MTFALSRLMSAATATYGVYALAEPRHLGTALALRGRDAERLDLLARTYGARDLALSTLGVFGRSEKTVTAVMLVRITCDVADGVLLSRETDDDQVRAKILGITFGWAALNALALRIDRRRAKKAVNRT
ncbi:MAG: hypothetical protein ACXVW2_08710 [Nocardioidaceae bacterium]